MYLFYLCMGVPDSGCTGPDGNIIKVRRSRNWKDGIIKHFESCKPGEYIFAGTAVNLETGEVLQNMSSYELPTWVNSPLLRAIKLEQWKKENEI